MEQIITPDKAKVTKLGIRTGVSFGTFFVAMFLAGIFFIARDLSLEQTPSLVLSFAQENIVLMFFLLFLPILPSLIFKSYVKKGKLKVVLNSEGILSQAGAFKKFIPWSKFTSVVPTKIMGRILMSSDRSGKIFILDVFDLDDLNTKINTYRNNLRKNP